MARFDEIDFRLDLSQFAQTKRITALEADQVAARELIEFLQDQLIERDMAYDRLESALSTARIIGAAVGVVMTLIKVTQDEAFGILSVISQRQNRTLRLIAEDIVLTGTI